MSRERTRFVIQQVDVEHALRKWDGRDVILKDNTSIERVWAATDREFLETFSNGRIDASLLSRFAASNNNDSANKRTGGYSIKRKFWGGLSNWTPRLKEFYDKHVLYARERYRQSGIVDLVWELSIQLAEMKGKSAKGNVNPLGIVAASKMLFFACPEMPIFIYDSVVGVALSFEKLRIDQYPEWWHRCNEILHTNSTAIPLLPKNRQSEFRDKAEWFTRRSLDLMLYRVGEEHSSGLEKVPCF